MSGYLVDIGYEVVTAGSVDEALAVVALNMPDINLMDIMMPGLNGYQVTRKLKNKRETSNMPIILVTALGANQAKVKGLEAGAFAHLMSFCFSGRKTGTSFIEPLM